ncbi:MAG: hypothetical protein AB7O67_12780 [Vicinamibacterales bacterium]
MATTRRSHCAWLFVVTALAVFAPGAGAQAPAHDPLFERLAGRWSGRGTVLGQATDVTLDWEWVLGDRFLRLRFTNRGLAYEGHAYYRADGDGAYTGMWFDTSGALRPIAARRDGQALVARWGDPGTEEGDTTYRLGPDDRLVVIDRVRQADGTWRVFGETTLTRVGGG